MYETGGYTGMIPLSCLLVCCSLLSVGADEAQTVAGASVGKGSNR